MLLDTTDAGDDKEDIGETGFEDIQDVQGLGGAVVGSPLFRPRFQG